VLRALSANCQNWHAGRATVAGLGREPASIGAEATRGPRAKARLEVRSQGFKYLPRRRSLREGHDDWTFASSREQMFAPLPPFIVCAYLTIASASRARGRLFGQWFTQLLPSPPVIAPVEQFQSLRRLPEQPAGWPLCP
jgi:hypothetical protein